MKKIFVVAVVIILIFLGWNYFKGDTSEVLNSIKGGNEKGAVETPAFGGEVYSKSGTENPIEKVPESNPFTKQINPFSEAKVNPF